jgi:hypothetical protein
MSRVVDYTLGMGLVLFHLLRWAIEQRHNLDGESAEKGTS